MSFRLFGLSLSSVVAFLFALVGFVSFNQAAHAGPAGTLAKSIDLTEFSVVTKVHGYHCKKRLGHRHKRACLNKRRCYSRCLRRAIWRFNCRNLYRFCIRTGVSKRVCRARYKRCLWKARKFCKRACYRR